VSEDERGQAVDDYDRGRIEPRRDDILYVFYATDGDFL